MTTFAELKVGDRIRLTEEMQHDPYGIPVGSEGTVNWLNDLSALFPGKFQIGVDWDSGRSLNLVEIDKWEKIDG